MGQDISKSYIPPPLSLRDCYVDGEIDLVRYRLYRRRTYKNLFIDVEAMIKKNNKGNVIKQVLFPLKKLDHNEQ